MADRMTPQQRHRCMSRIKGRDTKPEMLVRRWLWNEGWHYRLCVRGFPGKPDIVFRKFRTVVFVNGCFWHGHNVQLPHLAVEGGQNDETDSECCKIPHSNRDFWIAKITRNRERDQRNYAVYRQAGWHVLVVWECMLKPKLRDATLKSLSQQLNDIFLASISKPLPHKPKVYRLDEEEDRDLMIAAEDAATYTSSRKP